MRYFDDKNWYYPAAGIVAVVAFLLLFSLFGSWGWFGWMLNLLMIAGTGMILGDFIENWHIDFKFRVELDNFEDSLRDALKLKKNETLQ